jgi:hypothetical protein
MATGAPNQSLPLFYHTIEPLNATQHGKMHIRPIEKSATIGRTHAIPLTVDEFGLAQRHYPIVFSIGENPVPLALMGLNEGVNVFVDDEGKLNGEFYVPAYVRRYPFMLARLQPEAQELSLCFDPTSELVGEFEEGAALFDDGKPSEATNAILKFCEEFELSAQRTLAFVKELEEADLLMEGEVSIQPEGQEQPFVYRGFRMINEEKLRELRGDELRKMNQNGMLPLIMAHLFSLQLIREIFGKQLQQGKGPQVAAFQAPAGNA